jgi:hypothetical protein
MGRGLALPLALLLLGSCGNDRSCPDPPASCDNLVVAGHGYVVWRTVTPPPGAPGNIQEVGNATYPACNLCDDPFGGNRATDVWHLPGARRGQAVLGIREGSSEVFVIYVRRGVDPQSLHLRGWAAR